MKNRLKKVTLEVKTLDMILPSLIAGAIFNNYDLICLGMALYQSTYLTPIYPHKLQPGGYYPK